MALEGLYTQVLNVRFQVSSSERIVEIKTNNNIVLCHVSLIQQIFKITEQICFRFKISNILEVLDQSFSFKKLVLVWYLTLIELS